MMLKKIAYKAIVFGVMWLATSGVYAQNALIWYPGGNASSSAAAIETALAGQVASTTKTQSLSSYSVTPANFEYVFVCLGVNANNYVLDSTNDSADIQTLIDYLQAGGKLVMEGGDVWAWDAQTDLQPYFNLYGEADGDGDLQTLYGSACFSGYSFAYGGSQNYIDRIAPLDGSVVLFSNNSPSYACGVGYDDATFGYRTVAFSFEFGGLSDGIDTKADLMSDILNFLDGGCSTLKPAPMNLHAFGGYDGAVILAWDAPPGQSSLSNQAATAPSLTTSTAGGLVKNVSAKPGRQRPANKAMASIPGAVTTRAVGYQVDSYSVYRATTSGGPYTQLASGIDRQFYRDATAANGQSYYYIVKAVYSGSTGDASMEASAQAASGGAGHSSPWKFLIPSINGQIETDEWSNATTLTITAPGQTAPVTLYTFNDDNYFYFAVDESGNTTLSTDDQLGLSFDEDFNYNWPASSTTDEGTLWLNYESGSLNKLFRGLQGWWPLDVQWASPAGASGVTAAVSTASGHVQYEARLDLSSSALNVVPGNSFAMYLYTLDKPDSVFTGSWPAAVNSAAWEDAWLLPSLYGAVHLAAKASCPFISDDESVTGTTNYTFNEFGDGRKLELNVSSLGGSGVVTVTQTDECVANPVVADYVNCTWELTLPAGITDFVGQLTFHYNDADVAGFDENKLQVHRWVESSSSWQYEGGAVDAATNTVTLSTNQAGTFALFARDHVLVSAKALLEGAYDTGGLMTTGLNSNSAIPLVSTLADARVVGSIPAGVTDWVMLELRTTADGAALSQRSFFVKNNGDVVDWDGASTSLSLPDAAAGSYYLVIAHRNHLAVMSASAVALTGSAATAFDFTTGLDKFYGNDAALLDTSPTNIYGLYAGDATANGQVQNDDKNEDWKTQTGTSGYKSADFNLNAQVQNDDKNEFWKNNVGKGTQVP